MDKSKNSPTKSQSATPASSVTVTVVKKNTETATQQPFPRESLARWEDEGGHLVESGNAKG